MARLTKLTMSSSPSDLRLFGLDLNALWQDLRKPWQDMHSWPVFAWLTPTVPILLVHTDGHQSIWMGDETPLPASPSGVKAKAGRFVAIQLPEELILRRRLTMPVMSGVQTAEAVALEAHALSPFAPTDIVWGHSLTPGTGATVQVELALASRKQIASHLQSREAHLSGLATPEVWALSPSGRPIVMPGYGEARRFQHMRKWRRFGFSLVLLALLLIAAIAITPTAQLRFRAVEAVNAYTAVHQRTLPLAAKREELVKTSERLAALHEIVSNRMAPLKVMDLLTQALPDDTSLLGLQVQELKVTMNGQTTNAAALMQHLSAQPGIREVRAPSAATRPLGVSKDSFSLEFTLDPKMLSPVDGAAVVLEPSRVEKNDAAVATAPALAASVSAPDSMQAVSKPSIAKGKPAP